MAQDLESNESVASEGAKNSESFEFTWEFFQDKLVEWGINLAIAVGVLIVGFFITKRISKGIESVLSKRNFDESLKRFLVSIAKTTLRILVVLTALGQLGVEMTSFVALLAGAGLAIGMAFSGTLGNFAGGVMILIFRPYKVGDYIKAQGEEGTVQEIQIFNTILLTVDNKTIIIPNGSLSNGNITNYTMQETRRVDFSIGIGYGDDYLHAVKVLERFIAEDERILKDPAPFIGLGQLADSSVNITLRVWTKTSDYWSVHFEINRKVYLEFEKEGLNIPFPQMDVHVHNS